MKLGTFALPKGATVTITTMLIQGMFQIWIKVQSFLPNKWGINNETTLHTSTETKKRFKYGE